jgi:hypothetical protein
MRTHIRFRAALVAGGLLLLPLAGASAQSSPRDLPRERLKGGIIVHPERPEDAIVSDYQAMLGHGFNTLTSAARGDCVNLPFVVPASEGYDTHSEVSLIQSTDDLKRETSIEVSGSTGFGMITAEASASFSSSMHLSANSDYLLVRVTAVGPSVGGGTGELGSLAAKTKGNPQEFFTACGNRYISAVRLGGEFMALLEFTSSNESDREDVQASLKIASAASSLSATFKTAVEHAQAKSSMHMTISRRGTSEPFPEYTVDKLIAYSQEFPSKLNIKTVVAVGLVVSDYQSIDPGISTFEEEPEVDRLRQNMRAVNSELAEIDYLLGAYRSLGIVGRTETVEPIQRTLAPKPAAMQQALNVCGKAPWSGACKFPAAILDTPLPSLPPRPARVTFSILGGESLVAVLEAGKEATLMISGRFIYNGDDGGVADVAACSQVVLVGANGARTAFMYGNGKVAQSIKGPVSVSVVLIDSYYADNRDVDTPTALLY